MSLFQSAFDSPSAFGAGPSSKPLSVNPSEFNFASLKATNSKPKDNRPHNNVHRKSAHAPEKHSQPKGESTQVRGDGGGNSSKEKKRKRGGGGGGKGQGNGEQQLRSRSDLEKLMNQLDEGLPGDGGDTTPMGALSHKKKKKSKQEAQAQEHRPLLPESKALPGGGSPKAKVKRKDQRTTSGKLDTVTSDVPPSTLPPKPHQSPQKKDAGGEEEGLTKMQKGMKTKLEEARFRWINEQLYSNSSEEAVALMKRDPKVFADYHNTHRVLTANWPTPPLPYILKKLVDLPAGIVIVDLGCGDASLAKDLVPKGKTVLSYDLVGDTTETDVNPTTTGMKTSHGGWVVQADFLDHIPLPGRPGGEGSSVAEKKEKGKGSRNDGGDRSGSEIVDVVVCCLSLMGTNWVSGIYEACRILKQGGTFHIAEVTSRFISTDEFVSKVESFGFELRSQSAPTTHFTLFEFTKVSVVPLGIVKGSSGWQGRVNEGEGIMKGCVYKKR